MATPIIARDCFIFYNLAVVFCMQAVEVVRYTDEEYNEHLVDPVSEIMNFVQCTKCKNYLTLDYHCNCKFQSKNTAWSFWEEMFHIRVNVGW